MAEKAIRLGGESTADAIVSAVDSLYPEHTFEDKEFALKHNDDEIAVDTNFAAQNFWKEALIRFFNKRSAVLGLILIVHGVIDLQGALNLRAGHARHWWPAFLIALITLALGALILWNPFASINALLMLVGIALIYDGISDLLILFQLTRTFRKVQQGVEASVEAAEVIEGEGTVEQ